jgi:hypothetical protein
MPAAPSLPTISLLGKQATWAALESLLGLDLDWYSPGHISSHGSALAGKGQNDPVGSNEYQTRTERTSDQDRNYRTMQGKLSPQSRDRQDYDFSTGSIMTLVIAASMVNSEAIIISISSNAMAIAI